MGTSLPHKKLLRFVLLILVVVVTFSICPMPAATRLLDPAVVAAERPPMFVLQVGIGKYKYTPVWAELRGAVTDVVETRKVLEGERWGVPAENIVTLRDGEGTKQLIFEKFQTHLIAKARQHYEKTKNRDAVVMFQFSGHGSQVPDVDGDERDDHKDETLVTVDSQDAPGKNYDITDDEIFALTSELRRWTDNIVYVFDSCHSGSGTRDSQDVRRLPERKTVPVVVAGVGSSATRSGGAKGDDGSEGVLPPGDDYIVITAARPNELASQKNCFEECGATTRPVVYGNLTFYLIDELKNARADTSYRELMENVTRRVVAEKPTQTPQLEGDSSRFVFGSLGRTEDNFVRITSPETKRPNGDRLLKIAAGAMQGVTAGTIVSFYDKAVTRFDGAEKISSGTVTAATPSESTVMLLGPKREITIEDKSVIVAPDLGTMRLKVNLDADARSLTLGQKKVRTLLGNYLMPVGSADSQSRGVEVVSSQSSAVGRWDVGLLKDKYATVAKKISQRPACETPGKHRDFRVEGPNADRDVFYLAGKDFVPLFGFCMFADGSTEQEHLAAATRLQDAIVHLARLRSVNAISNKRSMLNGKIVVRPIKMEGPFGCENSRFVAGSTTPAVADPKTGSFNFSPGEVFWFEVTNNSAQDLYLLLLNMPPDGSVKLFSPRDRFDEQTGVVVAKNGGKRIVMSDQCRVDAAGAFLEAGAFRVSKVQGVDRFKLIVSTDPLLRENFEYLEMPALVARAGSSTMAGKKDWTTVETNLQITDTGK